MAWEGKGLLSEFYAFLSGSVTQSFLRKVVGMETMERVTFTLCIPSKARQSITDHKKGNRSRNERTGCTLKIGRSRDPVV